MKKNGDSLLFYVFLVMGLIFLRSSYGKIAGGEFVGGLPKTLEFFASKNPNAPVASFLTDVAIPNATLFAYLTMWGELMAAVCLLVPTGYYIVNQKLSGLMRTVLSLGLIVALFLNGTFWLAAGWTSPSTDSLNLLMVVIAVIGLVFVSTSGKNTR